MSNVALVALACGLIIGLGALGACIGIGILLLTQASVNMLVCTGIFPVTGQNMPLLAMGGSALIMTCVSIGIVQSIANRISSEKVGAFHKILTKE
jgi:cell division protein FtsW (lipid II flippase)